MPPLVSIIIPTYNRKNWVAKAIDSALAQTYKYKEVIVIDDGSTDGTYTYLEEMYGRKIILRKTKQNGVSKARNIGINTAKGEWLSFLDSDDLFHIDKIERQLSFLNKNPKFEIAHSDEIWYKNGIKIKPKKLYRKEGGYIFAKSVELCLISISTAIIHKNIFDKIGVFDENMEACEDYDFWLRVTAKHEVLFLDEYLTIKFSGHEDQLSQKYYAMDRFRIYALDKLLRSPQLSKEQRKNSTEAIKNKLKIFLDGAKKHGNYEVHRVIKNRYIQYLNNY